jgi:hypothetical protein
MHRVTSRKIGIFLTGLILLAWAVILTPSLCGAGMHELSDGEMAAVYAQGFSSFTLSTDTNTDISLATMSFPNISIGTYTQINQMAMGYYSKSGTTAWDNNWTNVSLGTPGTDLIAQGLYIKAEFSGITNNGTRQLDYVQIGTTSLKGDISANFNSFSGTIGGTTYNRTNLGAQTITSTGDINSGFNLSLAGSGSQKGFSFNFGSSSTIH